VKAPEQLSMFDRPEPDPEPELEGTDGFGEPFIGPLRIVGWRKLRSYARSAAEALEERKQVLVRCAPVMTGGVGREERLRRAQTYIFSEWDEALAIGPGCIQALLRFGDERRFVRVSWDEVRFLEIEDTAIIDPALIFQMLACDAEYLAKPDGEGGALDDSVRRALRDKSRFDGVGLSGRYRPGWECPERQRRTAAVLAQIEREEAAERASGIEDRAVLSSGAAGDYALAARAPVQGPLAQGAYGQTLEQLGMRVDARGEWWVKKQSELEEQRALEAAAEEKRKRERPDLEWQYGGNATGWVASHDVYEALNALERGKERHIDGKCFRLVAEGNGPGEKLFQVVNRGTGLKDHFFLAEAVEFALRGELVPNPGFQGKDRQQVCYLCDSVIPRKEHRGWSHGCAACGLIDLCSSCRTVHQDAHESDPLFSELPSAARQEFEREEHKMVVAIVGGLGPAARVLSLLRGTSTEFFGRTLFDCAEEPSE
jgi:hypothetical protein